MDFTNIKAWCYRNPVVGHYVFEGVRRKKLVASGMARSDFESLSLLRRLKALGLRPRTILDVGANRGEWTRNALRVFPHSEFRLIEPQSEMEPFLERIAETIPRSRYILAGAGSEVGELTLTLWDDLAGSSFVPTPASGLAGGKASRIVPLVSLDSLVEAGWMEVPDLVKMDVQGFELEVVRGGSKLLGKCEVFVLEAALMEFMTGRPLLEELVATMSGHGYKVFDLGGSARRPLDQALSHLDVCFAREDGLLRRSASWSTM